ncbi:hypothetical protein CAMGR0001_0825 [Campylobacter gracilis RM3268]|uniref:Uncharacterized protein n=1 Tax=Campylobacter gracilis RM3268 TaxID=553220 RepID=C8PG32_9BACT|nr:hypothetical protein CAMGR0001_0825 [Campylobacter gracilis RM3268]
MKFRAKAVLPVLLKILKFNRAARFVKFQRPKRRDTEFRVHKILRRNSAAK